MSCPSWCTAHTDPDWDSLTHLSDPVDVPIVLDTAHGPAAVPVTVGMVDAGAGVWMEIAPADDTGRIARVDVCSARRLAAAIMML